MVIPEAQEGARLRPSTSQTPNQSGMPVPGDAPAPAADPEQLYRSAFAAQWDVGLDWLHRHGAAAAADDGLSRAARTFTDALLTTSPTSALGAALEKLFLLHTGRLYRLTEPQFERVVERLVLHHHDRPEAALGYARFCPGNARCAETIRHHGAPVRQPVPSGEGHTVTQTRPRTDVPGATRPLFRSQQEADFFMAVRDVFAAYFAYPNVALSTLVDFEQVRERLSERERGFFFRGLVDCVVFDQHAGYRPVLFFELDSPLHDEAAQQDRDRIKDRVLALAGQRLYRIRRPKEAQGRAGFVALLRELF